MIKLDLYGIQVSSKSQVFQSIYDGNQDSLNIVLRDSLWPKGTYKKYKNSTHWVRELLKGRPTRATWQEYLHVANGIAFATDGHEARRGYTELSDGVYTYDLVRDDDEKNRFESISNAFAAVSNLWIGVKSNLIDAEAVVLVESRKPTLGFELNGVVVPSKSLLLALAGQPVENVITFAGRVIGAHSLGEFIISGLNNP